MASLTTTVDILDSQIYNKFNMIEHTVRRIYLNLRTFDYNIYSLLDSIAAGSRKISSALQKPMEVSINVKSHVN